MSFTAQVKEELSLLKQPSCCNISECYGMLIFARNFCLNKMNFQTSSEAAAKRCVHRIRTCFSVLPEFAVGGDSRKTYRVSVKGEADRKKILIALGHSDKSEYINTDILKRDCCVHAFLRGVFLSCGQVSDPEQDYRLELCVKSGEIAKSLTEILMKIGISLKETNRASGVVLYSKDSSVIEDFLTVIGATNAAIMVMQSKIYKDMRNKVNRIKNCETANIFKSVDAALEQRSAIELLEKKGLMSSLPPELINAAKLRMEYPEASLNELCRLCDESITRSGLNHRFRKIIEIAQELKKK